MIFDSRVMEGVEEVFSLFDTPTNEGILWEERLGVIKICLSKLSSNLRAAVGLVYHKDNSLQQAADELGISFSAVGKRLSRARTLIRECVSQSN